MEKLLKKYKSKIADINKDISYLEATVLKAKSISFNAEPIRISITALEIERITYKRVVVDLLGALIKEV